jgi:hypothetical protein
MIIDIKYNKETSYIGRNGEGRQTGIGITGHGDVITMEPINSKNNVANCMINIPYGDINNVLDALTKVLYDMENRK